MESQAAPLTGVHVWVQDMARTVAFYRRIGVQFPEGAESQPFVHAETGGGSMEFGTFELTRFYDPQFQPPTGRGNNCLQFRLPTREAVNETYATLLAAGHKSHLAPIDAYWGARYAEVLDPDGNAVGFQSPRDESMVGPAHPPGS